MAMPAPLDLTIRDNLSRKTDKFLNTANQAKREADRLAGIISGHFYRERFGIPAAKSPNPREAERSGLKISPQNVCTPYLPETKKGPRSREGLNLKLPLLDLNQGPTD